MISRSALTEAARRAAASPYNARIELNAAGFRVSMRDRGAAIEHQVAFEHFDAQPNPLIMTLDACDRAMAAKLEP